LSGNYYNNITLTGTPVYSKTEAVNFDWGTGSPNTNVTPDNFSARWEGEVQAPVSGVYAFSTISDDGVRLFVNNVKIIDNFTDHYNTTDTGSQTFTFTAGTKYKIKMEYYERGGGAVAKLLWTVPRQAQAAIPLDRLYPVTVAAGTGLSGNYYNNITLTGTPVYSKTEAVNFDWGTGSPNTSVTNDNFSARWEGEVKAPVSGVYSFSTISDDGVRLFVNGIKIIDNFTDHYNTTDNGNQSFTFTAGTKYKIKMEYYERTGGAVAKLLWTVPGQAQAAIPLSNLYPLVTTALRMQKSETVYTKEIQISPNPAHENTKLSFYSEKLQAVNISITDVNGRVVKSSQHKAFEGFNTIMLQLPKQPGIYIIQVLKDGKTEMKKIGVN
jgi:hypothetical protein